MLTTILGSLFSHLAPYILPVLGAFAAFFFAKRKGKKEAENKMRMRTIQDYAATLETKNEIVREVDATPADALRERLRDYAVKP